MNDVIVLSIFAVFIFFVARVYNKVIKKKNESEKAFATVEVLLKKRYDLLPNLIENVKQHALFEASVLNEITETQEYLNSPVTFNSRIELYNMLDNQTKTLMKHITTYPELKTGTLFLQLQGSWNETEEQISAARRYYNATVAEYNSAVQSFPANILMNKTSYPEKKYLEFSEEEKENISAGKLFRSNN
jgi:LemA protein